MYVSTYVRMCWSMYVLMFVYMYVCMCCMYVCICIDVYMYWFMHVYACMHVYKCICIYVCMHVHMYVCMYVCMHVLHACMWVCMYACMWCIWYIPCAHPSQRHIQLFMCEGASRFCKVCLHDGKFAFMTASLPSSIMYDILMYVPMLGCMHLSIFVVAHMHVFMGSYALHACMDDWLTDRPMTHACHCALAPVQHPHEF